MSAQARRARREAGDLAGMLIALQRIASRPWEPTFAKPRLVPAGQLTAEHIGGRIRVTAAGSTVGNAGYLRGFKVSTATSAITLFIGIGGEQLALAVGPTDKVEVVRGVS